MQPPDGLLKIPNTLPMNVQELIEKLSTLPPGTRVVVDGYEGGVSDPCDPELVTVRLDVNPSHYLGPHEIDPTGDIPAVYLARPSRKEY